MLTGPWPSWAGGEERSGVREYAPLASVVVGSALRPSRSRPWDPDWATHKVAEAPAAAGVELDIKGGRHYTVSQLMAGGFDLPNTATRLGHSGGGATTLRHHADPVSEVDRRAAAYLAQLTARSAAQNGR